MPRPPRALVATALGLMLVGCAAPLAAADCAARVQNFVQDDPNNPNNPNGFEQSDDPYNRDLKNRDVEPINPTPHFPRNGKPIIP